MFESINSAQTSNWPLRIAATAAVIAIGAVGITLWRMIQMPLRSHRGPLPPISAPQSDLSMRLEEHVRYLSISVGERNVGRKGSLRLAADYIRAKLEGVGYKVGEQTFPVNYENVSNLEAELAGTSVGQGMVVIGAHYDSVFGTVGANDNVSGVAATLELARMLSSSNLRRNIRFLFFVNEEPPFFQTEQMGSLVYAKQLRHENVPVAAMISLETIGYYSDAPGSQKYPAVLGLFYPSRGDFIGFVGNSESRHLVRSAVREFRKSAAFPSEGVAAPESWPGVGWSDHWSFWQQGYHSGLAES